MSSGLPEYKAIKDLQKGDCILIYGSEFELAKRQGFWLTVKNIFQKDFGYQLEFHTGEHSKFFFGDYLFEILEKPTDKISNAPLESRARATIHNGLSID